MWFFNRKDVGKPTDVEVKQVGERVTEEQFLDKELPVSHGAEFNGVATPDFVRKGQQILEKHLKQAPVFSVKDLPLSDGPELNDVVATTFIRPDFVRKGQQILEKHLKQAPVFSDKNLPLSDGPELNDVVATTFIRPDFVRKGKQILEKNLKQAPVVTITDRMSDVAEKIDQEMLQSASESNSPTRGRIYSKINAPVLQYDAATSAGTKEQVQISEELDLEMSDTFEEGSKDPDPYISVLFSPDLANFIWLINNTDLCQQLNYYFNIEVPQYSQMLLCQMMLERVTQGLPPGRAVVAPYSNVIQIRDQWGVGMVSQNFAEVAREQWVQNMVGTVGTPLARRFLCYSKVEEFYPTGWPNLVW